MMIGNLLTELAVVGAEIINEAIREVQTSHEMGVHAVPEAFIVGIPELKPYYEESSFIKEHMSFNASLTLNLWFLSNCVCNCFVSA